MEDLTKTQLILLALLVSFVTSMATGIVAVTLMEQAPEPLVQTINRVVERTVETVREAIPVADKTQRQSVVTKETTIVVKEEDLITSTIAKNATTLVRLSAPGGLNSDEEFVGLGVVVGDAGTVATDAALVSPTSRTLQATFTDGTSYAVIALPDTGDSRIAFLKLVGTTTSAEGVPTADRKFPTAVFADASALKLGQTVIALGGERRTAVAIGIISALVHGTRGGDVHEREDTSSEIEASSTEESSRIRRILALETTLAVPHVLPGTPIFNIFGELVALALSTPDPDTREYVASSELSRLMTAASSAVSLDTR